MVKNRRLSPPDYCTESATDVAIDANSYALEVRTTTYPQEDTKRNDSLPFAFHSAGVEYCPALYALPPEKHIPCIFYHSGGTYIEPQLVLTVFCSTIAGKTKVIQVVLKTYSCERESQCIGNILYSGLVI